MIIDGRILEGMPSDWMPGIHWYVEYHLMLTTWRCPWASGS